MDIIINADDFGLTLGISKGIIEGLQHGVLTDTSAIVHTPDFKKSAQLALVHGIQEMGIHCLLTMGYPVLPKDQVKSLVNEQGRFYSREEFFATEVDMHEVRAELKAQIDCFLESGLLLNHIDTHHGFMNKSKEMTALFQELAQEYKVPLRNEASRYTTPLTPIQVTQTRLPSTDVLYFNHGYPYHTFDRLSTDLRQASTLYESIEIGCHPGYSDEQLRSISILHDDREKELQLFLDKRLFALIQELDGSLISYTTWMKNKQKGNKEYETTFISGR